MRGTQLVEADVADDRGIIPAHAGNTGILPGQHEADRDHPRACGEHSVIGQQSQNQQGSSPRMRGTPLRNNNHDNRLWIIPAHAGNT